MPTEGLPANIKREREVAGLSRRQLADLLALPLHQIVRWEDGTRRPSVSHVRLIAVVLGVTVGRLHGDSPAQKLLQAA